MTKQEMAAGISMLAAVFDEPISENMLEVYWLVFRDKGADEFLEACLRILEESDRFPAPAVILRYFPKETQP
jgi:hypothetical protein